MTRTSYEWERKIDKTAVFNNIEFHKKEIKRITETTLRGNFTNSDDREYWVKRLKQLNGELIHLEQLYYTGE